jgi:hypothetical protein
MSEKLTYDPKVPSGLLTISVTTHRRHEISENIAVMHWCTFYFYSNSNYISELVFSGTCYLSRVHVNTCTHGPYGSHST